MSKKQPFYVVENIETNKAQRQSYNSVKAVKWLSIIFTGVLSGVTVFAAGVAKTSKDFGLEFISKLPESTAYATGAADILSLCGIGLAVRAEMKQKRAIREVDSEKKLLRQAVEEAGRQAILAEERAPIRGIEAEAILSPVAQRAAPDSAFFRVDPRYAEVMSLTPTSPHTPVRQG